MEEEAGRGRKGHVLKGRADRGKIKAARRRTGSKLWGSKGEGGGWGMLLGAGQVATVSMQQADIDPAQAELKAPLTYMSSELAS